MVSPLQRLPAKASRLGRTREWPVKPMERALRTTLCLMGGAICLPLSPAVADDTVPQRPAILFNRWQEDWSVLADPRVVRQPGDEFKYIPLSATDP